MSRRIGTKNLSVISLLAVLSIFAAISMAYAVAIEPGIPKDMRLAGPGLSGDVTIAVTEDENLYDVSGTFYCEGQTTYREWDGIRIPLLKEGGVENFEDLTAEHLKWADLGSDILKEDFYPYDGVRTVVGIDDFVNTGTEISARVNILRQVRKPTPLD